jgi:hypothetical protein
MDKVVGAANAMAILVLVGGCRQPSRSQPTPTGPGPSTSAQPAAAGSGVPDDARPSGQDSAPGTDFDPKAGEEVLRDVFRLPFVEKACDRHCSLTVGNDGHHWVVTVGYDRAPAAVTPLHLFSVLVEPNSRKAVSVDPGAMYGFCTTPIPVEKWERYAARYKRYLNDKGPEPECP